MNEQLKKALELALKNKGLKEGLSKFINVTSEAEIDGAIADYIALSGVEIPTTEQLMQLPAVKSYVDQERTKAVNTNTANLAKKYNFDPSKEPTNPNPNPNPNPNDDMPAWAKTLLERNEALEQKITGFETQKSTEQKRSEALAKLKSSTVLPDSFKSKWENRIDVNSETSFEDQVKSLETEYTEFAQTIANESGFAYKPGGGKGTTEASVDDVAKMWDNK